MSYEGDDPTLAAVQYAAFSLNSVQRTGHTFSYDESLKDDVVEYFELSPRAKPIKNITTRIWNFYAESLSFSKQLLRGRQCVVVDNKALSELSGLGIDVGRVYGIETGATLGGGADGSSCVVSNRSTNERLAPAGELPGKQASQVLQVHTTRRP